MDRPQIKTREAVSHASSEAGRPATAPAAHTQQIKDMPDLPTPIKTKDIFTVRAKGGGAPVPAGRRGAGRPTGGQDISGHPVDGRNASGCSAPVKPVIKTKESYITQSAVPTDKLQPMMQGSQEFVREQGRTAAVRQAEIRRSNQRPGSGTVGGGDVPPSASNRSYTNRHQGKQTHFRVVPQAEQVRAGTIREGGEGTRRTTRKVKTPLKTLGRKARNAVKTAERPTGQAVRAADRTARTTQRTAQAAVRAAQKAAQRAVQTTRVTTRTTKTAVKAAAAAAKGAIAALKALAAAVAAGGSVVIIVVLVICLVGLLIASPFGIFFADGSSPDSASPSAAIVQLNGEFSDKLTELQAGGGYDRVEVQGGPPTWAEVFAVFTARTAGADNALPVAVLDTDTMERLRTVFWDMTKITTAETTVDHPASGSTPAWTETVLTITVTPRTPDDMRVFYSFTDQQNATLDELLTPENLALWSNLLYSASSGIVAVALSQVGNVGGQPYWSWYGFNRRVEWCACFVSWCANECGYIDAGVIPKFSGCDSGANWFKNRDLWQGKSYAPRPGDIIFFDWDDPGGFAGPQDGSPDHVGIVERVENGIIYTVEGNSGDSCCQRSYSVGYYEVFGFGTPLYN